MDADVLGCVLAHLGPQPALGPRDDTDDELDALAPRGEAPARAADVAAFRAAGRAFRAAANRTAAALTPRRASDCEDAGVRGLGERFPALRSLDMRLVRKEVSDEALYDVLDSSLVRVLVRLDLRCCTLLSSAALARLGELRAVRVLKLAGVPALDDAALEALSHAPSLERLDVSGCEEVRAEGVAALAPCTRLRHLDVSWCARVRDEAFSPFSVRLNWESSVWQLHWENLTSLSLAGNQLICDRTMVRVGATMNKLKRLDLSWCARITDLGVAALTPLSLEVLGVSGCTQLSDASLRWVSVGGELRKLDVSWNPKITDMGVLTLVHLPNLEVVNARFCDHVNQRVRSELHRTGRLFDPPRLPLVIL